MIKKEKLINCITNAMGAYKKSITALTEQKTKNTLTEEASAQIDAAISEKESQFEMLKQLKEQAESAGEDMTEETLSKLAELQAKVTEMENSKKLLPMSVKVKNFLNDKKSLKLFQNAVKLSNSKDEFLRKWQGVLIENGITPTDALLPGAVVSIINDTFEKVADGFMSLLDVTGLRVLKSILDTNTDATTSRALGHKKGTQKSEEGIVGVAKEIRPQMIYKYITIDREIEMEDENGVLMNYIAKELSMRIIHEIMRCVLVGDGRAANSNAKISKFESIDRAASDNYVTLITSAARVATIEEVKAGVDSIEAEGDITLCMSRAQCTALQKFIAATGGTVQYKSIEEVCGELGVSKIICTKVMAATAAADPIVVGFVGKSYKVVGDMTMEGFQNFNLEYNKNEYLTEVYAGGGLVDAFSGFTIRAGA